MGEEFGMQYIMDANGNYYCVNANDQLVVAASREKAAVFTLYDANQRIGGGRKARFYQAVPVDDTAEPTYENVISMPSKMREENPTEKTESAVAVPQSESINPKGMEVSVQKKPCAQSESMNPDELELSKKSRAVYDIAQINWQDYLNGFCELSSSVKGYQEELEAKHSAVDKEICDLLHYIELYDLSDAEAMKAVDMLKDARCRRRDIKDELMRTDLFQKSIGTSANVAKAKSCIRELKKLDTRIYHPRELPELFEGMNDRKTNRETYRERHNICRERDFKAAESVSREQRSMEKVRRETIFDGKENDWLKLAKEQADFFTNIEQYMTNIEIDLEEIEDAIEERMQKAENINCNAAQGYEIFKELKTLRLKRKEKRAQLDQLCILTECFDCAVMADIYQYAAEQMENCMENELAAQA